jgi:hypothetical protein
MKNATRVQANLLLQGGLSVASVILSRILLAEGEFGPPGRLVAALLPVPFFLALVHAEMRCFRESDEFHRAVMLHSLAIAFPAAIVLGVVVDALQKGGFVTSWSVGDVWPFMAILWIPALWISRRRYR